MIVAGGGMIGLSCAWRLRARGHSVTVFDARETGAEASWAGAGMLAPGGEIAEDSALAGMALASLAQYPAFLAELREASGVPIEFRQCGAMEVAATDCEAEALERKAAHQAGLGIRSETARFRGFAGARFYPDDAVVNPRDMMAALKTACLRTGVVIREHEAVIGVLDEGRTVRTARGEYRDDGVVIAAGAWSSGLFPGLAPTMPVRGHLISFKAGTLRLEYILRNDSTYILPRGETIIAGSSIEHVGFDRRIDTKITAAIRESAEALFPEVSEMEPSGCWNGFRPGIEGAMPAVGRVPGTAIWTAFGHYRNGILLAPETARMIVTASTFPIT